MTDLNRLARETLPVDQLIEAVAARRPDAVINVLDPLDRIDLEAITIILAARTIALGRPTQPTPQDIEQAIHNLVKDAVRGAAMCFRIDPADIYNGGRRRDITDARQVACYTARLFGISMPKIAKHVGYADHQPVFNAISRVGEDRHLREVATKIAEALGWNREDGGDVA